MSKILLLVIVDFERFARKGTSSTWAAQLHRRCCPRWISMATMRKFRVAWKKNLVAIYYECAIDRPWIKYYMNNGAKHFGRNQHK